MLQILHTPGSPWLGPRLCIPRPALPEYINPPPTSSARAFGVGSLIGTGRGVQLGRHPCRHTSSPLSRFARPFRPRPRTSLGPTDTSGPNDDGPGPMGKEDDGAVVQLWLLGTKIGRLCSKYPVHYAEAFAVHKWAPIDLWITCLRSLGKSAVFWHDTDRDAALRRHIMQLVLVAKGCRSATICGQISTPRMAELSLVPPTVSAVHWAMATGAGRLYWPPAPDRHWASPERLRHMAS